MKKIDERLAADIAAYLYERTRFGYVKKTEIRQKFKLCNKTLSKLTTRYFHAHPGELHQYISLYFLLIISERKKGYSFIDASRDAGFEDYETAARWWRKFMKTSFRDYVENHFTPQEVVDERFVQSMDKILYMLGKKWGQI